MTMITDKGVGADDGHGEGKHGDGDHGDEEHDDHWQRHRSWRWSDESQSQGWARPGCRKDQAGQARFLGDDDHDGDIGGDGGSGGEGV